MFHVKHQQLLHPRSDIRSMTNSPSDRVLISNVSRETFEKASVLLEKHALLLDNLIKKWLWWNQSVNLFSRKTDAALLEKHIYHSFLLVFTTAVPDCRTVVDAGTGGGLPGLPMAVANGEKEFLLVDKVQKKCLAIRDIVRSLRLSNVNVMHSDISKIPDRYPARIVSKHAFPVKKILEHMKNKDWEEIALLKGTEVLSEIDADMTRHFTFSFRAFGQLRDPFFDNRGILLIHKKDLVSDSHEQQ